MVIPLYFDPSWPPRNRLLNYAVQLIPVPCVHCQWLNAMFNDVVAKKMESATTAFKKTDNESTKKPTPPKSSQKKIETNQSDPDADPKQKKSNEAKARLFRSWSADRL